MLSPIFSHGCPDFMSHPSMQFRIIKTSAVACPNPILTWCKISTRCCFLNAILQLSKHFQCIQQKFTTFSLSLCLSSRCSCCSSGCCCCETHSDTHADAAVADVCVRMVWLLGVFWRELQIIHRAALQWTPRRFHYYGQRGFLLSFLTTIVKWAKCFF